MKTFDLVKTRAGSQFARRLGGSRVYNDQLSNGRGQLRYVKRHNHTKYETLQILEIFQGLRSLAVGSPIAVPGRDKAESFDDVRKRRNVSIESVKLIRATNFPRLLSVKAFHEMGVLEHDLDEFGD